MDDKNIAHDDDFDGIEEENNPLPRWWLITFYITMIYAPIYFFMWHGGEGKSITKIYEKELAEFKTKFEKTKDSGDSSELEAAITDANRIAAGKVVYQGYCQVCHADQGQGLIGPNLTDRFWKHGKGSAADIFNVANMGVPDKGMPAWGQMLKKDELINVVAFVKSISNTEVAGKPPEGEKVE